MYRIIENKTLYTNFIFKEHLKRYIKNKLRTFQVHLVDNDYQYIYNVSVSYFKKGSKQP